MFEAQLQCQARRLLPEKPAVVGVGLHMGQSDLKNYELLCRTMLQSVQHMPYAHLDNALVFKRQTATFVHYPTKCNTTSGACAGRRRGRQQWSVASTVKAALRSESRSPETHERADYHASVLLTLNARRVLPLCDESSSVHHAVVARR